MAEPLDPLGLMRQWVNEWEKLANSHGSEWLAKPEVARAMQGATAAGLQAQGVVHDAMAKVLAAANLPSKADIEALGARLTAIEAAIARLERRDDPGMVERPKPKRTRQPG